MLGVASIIIMSIILLSLTVLMVVLFMKHLNVMYEFIEEILKVQTVLYKEVLSIKINLNHLMSQEVIQNTENKEEVMKDTKNTEEKHNTYPLLDNNKGNINKLDSSEVSDEELSKLIKGKDLMFKKKVNVNSDDEFINTDINI